MEKSEGVFSGDGQLNALLFLGKAQHEFQLMGAKVIMDLYPTGKEEEIQRRITGLDEMSRAYAYSVFAVSNSLRSVGGYDFQGGSVEEKLKFVRQLAPPVFEIFRQNLADAKLKQQLRVSDLISQMGKSQPDQSSEPIGEP